MFDLENSRLHLGEKPGRKSKVSCNKSKFKKAVYDACISLTNSYVHKGNQNKYMNRPIMWKNLCYAS